MKENVDLTLNRDFHKTPGRIGKLPWKKSMTPSVNLTPPKHECWRCGKIIALPWNDPCLCSSCSKDMGPYFKLPWGKSVVENDI